MSELAHPILLELKGISKSFPGVQALEGMNLVVREGEIHALLGENGAGKSTLIKILSGAYSKDKGEILYKGKPIEILSPHHAQQLGISTIYQEFNLAPHLTVPENIFMGHLPTKGLTIDWATARARSMEVLDRLGITLPMDVPAGTLSVADQQLVEIAKALVRETKLLIMDEPSAVLGEEDLEKLFKVVKTLQANGIAIIYISHRLIEVFEIAEKVTVMKDGRLVGTKNVSEVNMNLLVRMMIGRDLQDIYPKKTNTPGEVLLKVQGLQRPGVLKDISFELHRGEILGVAGMRGAGRTELARAIFGADPHSGHMELGDKPFHAGSPSDAIRQKVALATEDRKTEGLFLQQSVRTNVTISGLMDLARALVINKNQENLQVQTLIHRLRIKTPSSESLVSGMSGGNQQKVVFARWLNIGVQVFLMDEPTRGIDVVSKYEIYQIMVELASKGTGIIMISSELPEILGMSDRILVMHEGQIAQELSRDEATEERIMHYATGTHLQEGKIAV
jgi:ribose transport system ATP-binding protein